MTTVNSEAKSENGAQPAPELPETNVTMQDLLTKIGGLVIELDITRNQVAYLQQQLAEKG